MEVNYNLELTKIEAVILLSVLQQSISNLENRYSNLTIVSGQDNGFLQETAIALMFQMSEIRQRIEILLEK